MSTGSPLLHVNDQSLALVLAAYQAILVITKSDCGACVTYQADIERLLGRGKLAGIVIGKLVLDQSGSSGFKRANPWLADVTHLPYTVLYRHGQIVDRFAASKGSYLVERVEDAFVEHVAVSAG
jgi:hypothetical protein